MKQTPEDVLAHFGILGMKWGVRRFQNKDGSLTAEGKKRQARIDNSREEGIRVAKEKQTAKEQGVSAATALRKAEQLAKEGKVEKDFLNNPHISQKAKDKVLKTADKGWGEKVLRKVGDAAFKESFDDIRAHEKKIRQSYEDRAADAYKNRDQKQLDTVRMEYKAELVYRTAELFNQALQNQENWVSPSGKMAAVATAIWDVETASPAADLKTVHKAVAQEYLKIAKEVNRRPQPGAVLTQEERAKHSKRLKDVEKQANKISHGAIEIEVDELLPLEESETLETFVLDISYPKGFTLHHGELNDDSLQHWGILGMKWGVRRERGPDGRVVKTGGKVKSEDFEKTRELRKNAPDGLSTAELKALTQRLELEKKYKDLDPHGIQKGHTVAKAFLAGATTVTSIYAISKTPLAQDVAEAVTAVLRKKTG